MRINPVSQQNLRVQNDTPAFKAKFKAMSPVVKKIFAEEITRKHDPRLNELMQTFSRIHPGKVIEVDVPKSIFAGDVLEFYNPETQQRKNVPIYKNYGYPAGFESALLFLTHKWRSYDFWHDKSLNNIFVD